ncbi:MAG: arginine--tRNA ligase [Acidimicrobiales bacterium]
MITDNLQAALRETLSALGVNPLPDTVNLERPGNHDHGDWSSNVALASARNAGRNPRDLALAIAEHLNSALPAQVTKVEVAGPGFVNFYLSNTWLYNTLRAVVAGGPDNYGRHHTGAGVRVNVEFVSANPTGPLHAGHARGAVYGDAIASLFEAVGHAVEREFYINDRGTQMRTFAASLLARKNGQDPPEDGYVGQYIIDWARQMPDGLSFDEVLEWGYAYARADQVEVLASLGIVFDTWFSERSLLTTGAIEESLDDLRRNGVVFEEDGATWLRSTDYGDDKNRVLIRSDGEYTYITPDIAYHRHKFDRADRLVNVWGADHHGYISRMKAAMEALGHDADELQVEVTQMVRLMRGDQEVKLSKRTGEIIELRDIVAEIGSDATRFTYLLQSVETPQTFDLDVAASSAMENPVFYVQMAHARLRSIQAKAAQAAIATLPLEDVDLTQLVQQRELELLRQLQEFPDIVAIAARERAPHKIANWLREFAAAVHGFYHDCYVMGDGIAPELTQARLWLVEAARIGLVSGLGLLGVSAPDSM